MAQAVADRTEVQDLTLKQLAIYDHIRQLLRGDGLTPSLEEIAIAAGVTVSSAATAVRRFRTMGFLEREPGKSRSLRLTDKRPPRVRVA